jgi:hypothetical protein
VACIKYTDENYGECIVPVSHLPRTFKRTIDFYSVSEGNNLYIGVLNKTNTSFPLYLVKTNTTSETVTTSSALQTFTLEGYSYIPSAVSAVRYFHPDNCQ